MNIRTDRWRAWPASNAFTSWKARNRELVFWLSFLLLNALLFLPLYLLDLESSTFLPKISLQPGHPVQAMAELFVRRENADIFRLSAELLLLVSLYANVRRLRGPALRSAIVVAYIVILVYQVYEGVTVSLYKADPAFYNQFFLARDGVGFLVRHLSISIPAMMLGAIIFAAALGVVSSLLKTLFRGIAVDDLSRGSRVTLAALALALIFSGATAQQAFAQPESVVNSLLLKLRANIDESIRLYRDVSAFDDETFRRAYALDALTLAETPNIYLIFVESYGSVLYRRPDFELAYSALLLELESELTAGGWHVASTLSESTTWGGGSWLAYTSALFGMPIEAHPQYLALLDRFGNAENPYPSLARLLQAQGYHTIWISSIAEEITDALWQQYRDFFGIETWLRHSELAYDGAQYGWGPAPPDQYVLEYTRANVVKTDPRPAFLFFITQNSHFPWQTPPLVENWRALLELDPDGQERDDAEDVPHQALRIAYMNAIEYELRFLTQSVLDSEDETALFVFVGDHQPPRVSRRNDSFDTPIHILTRNPRIAAELGALGFHDGLVVPVEESGMKHEGLYSLLRYLLAAGYGIEGSDLPAYLPEGVPSVIEDAVETD
ncbi:MAG: sulfatase-like hydrolase/transferase [Chloroflexota bacterium]|nr:sulfatase-like hydrolase/transferase [Chloroflexota bacterium]